MYTPVYTSPDTSDEAWASINTGVGHVVLDKIEASAKGLPGSLEYPPDKTKAVYYVAAYHGLHCVVSPIPTLRSS